MNTERCSCGAREKNKCSKESEHNSGKMCLRDENKAFDQLTEKLWKEHPEEMAEAKVWAQEFINKQKCLGVEFEQLLADNLTNLYEN